MSSTVRCPPLTRMLASPRPVLPADPTSLSAKHPAPMMGESPARPGILKPARRRAPAQVAAPIDRGEMDGAAPLGLPELVPAELLDEFLHLGRGVVRLRLQPFVLVGQVLPPE